MAFFFSVKLKKDIDAFIAWKQRKKKEIDMLFYW